MRTDGISSERLLESTTQLRDRLQQAGIVPDCWLTTLIAPLLRVAAIEYRRSVEAKLDSHIDAEQCTGKIN